LLVIEVKIGHGFSVTESKPIYPMTNSCNTIHCWHLWSVSCSIVLPLHSSETKQPQWTT